MLSSADFFQNQLFLKKIQEHYQSENPGSDPVLGPKCLQRLSAEDKSCC